jgi:hypothetical protein
MPSLDAELSRISDLAATRCRQELGDRMSGVNFRICTTQAMDCRSSIGPTNALLHRRSRSLAPREGPPKPVQAIVPRRRKDTLDNTEGWKP